MSTSSEKPPAPPQFDPENPGHWKLALMLDGLRISAELAEEFERATGVPVTHRLLLEFPKGVLCLAHLGVAGRRGAEAERGCSLSATDDGWRVSRGGESIVVQVRPPIESELGGRVVRIDDYVLADLSRANRAAALRAPLGFPAEHAQAAPATPDPVLDAIEKVARSRTLRGVHLLAYDDPALDDAESALVRLGPLYKLIHRNFATSLAVSTWPPESVAAVETAYASGADLLYFHLGQIAAKSAAGIVPERALLSTERYEWAFDAATDIMESGSVKSALLLDEKLGESGLERAVRRLVKDNVVPLVWTAPLSGTREGWRIAASALAFAARALEKSKLNLARVEERALQLPPSELRYFHPKQKAVVGGLQSAAQTGFGRVAQRNLSALRRHLRVRGEPSDPAE